MKKFLSFFLCLCTAFLALSGGFPCGGASGAALTAEAASGSYKKMLPYHYEQLSSSEKEHYLKIRSAFINMEKSVKINILKTEADKLMNIIAYSDVLTLFNDGGQYFYSFSENGMDRIKEIGFTYSHKKSDYNKIIKFADDISLDVIAGFTQKMSDYEKITIIHDRIISECEYKKNSPESGSIYGVFSDKKAKCDGYAHAFSYICTKSGIKNAAVVGNAKIGQGPAEGHVWNKVYCGGKWYNVDCTLDDSFSGSEAYPKGYRRYRYFMTSDLSMGETHTEDARAGLLSPPASDGENTYYKKNGLYAGSREKLKKLLISEAAKAAKNGSFVAAVQIKSGITLGKSDISEVLSAADKKTRVKLITKGAVAYPLKEGEDTVYVLQFFEKGTSISDYYYNAGRLGRDTRDHLISLGLKNK